MSVRTAALVAFTLAGLALADRRATPPPSPQAHANRTEPDQARPLAWLLHAQNAEGGWGPRQGHRPTSPPPASLAWRSFASVTPR
jgi:hypothetical protein